MKSKTDQMSEKRHLCEVSARILLLIHCNVNRFRVGGAPKVQDRTITLCYTNVFDLESEQS